MGFQRFTQYCARFLKIGRFKKSKDEEPLVMAIGEPYDIIHELHVTESDVHCAIAATGGNITTIDDVTKWRSPVKVFPRNTPDGEHSSDI